MSRDPEDVQCGGRVGQGAPIKGKSYAGNNNLGKYRLCAMNDLVHYLQWCVKLLTYLVLEFFASGGSCGGVRSHPLCVCNNIRISLFE